MTDGGWTPQRAANRLVKVVEAVSMAHGIDRFPVDVPQLALESARIFNWSAEDKRLSTLHVNYPKPAYRF